MKHPHVFAAMLLLGAPALFAQSAFDDDIYYNPSKDKAVTKQTKTTTKKKSNYIANMGDMDVDVYNRRGEAYYTTPVDTIGTYAENAEDFVYTQQIQKYYNPTIVVDNADVLADVLSNAYGNVEIVIDNNGLPIFTPYTYAYAGWPYYRNWWNTPGWGFSFGGWGWNVGFYDPWYSWGWGPSWSWGPSWAWGPAWGYGPGWGWGPAWGPAYRPGVWGPQPPMASWRPNGNRPAGARPGWSSNTRPGGNVASRVPSRGNGNTGYRPAAGSRPGVASTRPAGGTGVTNNNGRWEYNTTATTGHRQPNTGVVNSGNSSVSTGNRTSGYNRGTGTTNSSSRYNNSSNTSTRNNSSYNTRNNSSSSSRNNSSYSPSRSSGSYGSGARSTGGGSRSGGGRGGRR